MHLLSFFKPHPGARLAAALLAVLLALALAVPPPAQAGSDGPIDYVRVDGRAVDDGETVNVTANEVEIRVGFDTDTVTGLKIGSVASFTYTGGDWKVDDTTDPKVGAWVTAGRAEVDHYPLQPGKNTVTITATVTGGSPGLGGNTFTVTVNFIDEPLEDASHRVPDITETTKIQAFDKAFTLDFGKKNYLRDGNDMADDQSVLLTVVEMDAPPPGFIAKSPVYRLTLDDEDYTLAHPATMTITFDPYTSTGAAAELTVYYTPDPDGDFDDPSALNLGGLVKGNAVTVNLSGPIEGCYAVCAAATDFPDFARLGWAYHSVMPLWAKGVMEPYNTRSDPWRYGYRFDVGAGQFGLFLDGSGVSEVKISRGEFTVMIVKALGLSTGDRPPGVTFREFSYVDASYRPYLETAVARGLLRGAPDGSCPVMGYGATLTREQAAVLLARAAELKVDTDLEKVDAALAKAFGDYAANPDVIAPWARPAVLACHKAKLINGIPIGNQYHFRARDPLTRAQAAALVHRLMVNKKLL
ncbi:MAG: S-layer homology domain-containing protein [Bacillota bacterium]|nr:S-layer homology domain-containing protein [Bacillota bacterium]